MSSLHCGQPGSLGSKTQVWQSSRHRLGMISRKQQKGSLFLLDQTATVAKPTYLFPSGSFSQQHLGLTSNPLSSPTRNSFSQTFSVFATWSWSNISSSSELSKLSVHLSRNSRCWHLAKVTYRRCRCWFVHLEKDKASVAQCFSNAKDRAKEASAQQAMSQVLQVLPVGGL